MSGRLSTHSAILGWGMPAAVGTSLQLDRNPVVCLVGDRSATYSPQALWTAAHERLPISFVVLNNGEYSILKKLCSCSDKLPQRWDGPVCRHRHHRPRDRFSGTRRFARCASATRRASQ
ncbi:thiamine pyrophosphate-dependent enzyme [Paraburkholderia humisilvae]|uniref:thiamine pyrophosphate-dependent enzyme n=1 Tax=Paraburkholderia humisilvae TaxID=627669 RepID=UPI001C2E4873|nr:thiamine pyrophosphate-dependent enzyme [Paraburkholderia humisilvae]